MRNAAAALFGTALGATFLWLSIGHIDGDELRRSLTEFSFAPIGIALALYWTALGLRVVRWSGLLRQIGFVRTHHVAETLIIGYAVNNVLPTRLGELFRADYAKRRFGFSRTTILGSILIERMLDLCVIALLLVTGLVFAEIGGGSGVREQFEYVAVSATTLIGLVVIGVYFLRSGELSRIPVPDAARRLVGDFVVGVGSLNRRSLITTGALSLGVWIFELLALVAMFHAAAIDLGASEALVVMGAMSLSTLVPTAPGYIGTYQLVAALAMAAFGHSETLGIIAATGIQVFLFGGVTLVGVGALIIRSLARLQAGDTAD